MTNENDIGRMVAVHTLYQPSWAGDRLIRRVDRTSERCFHALNRKHLPPHHDFERLGNSLAQTRDVICSAVRARFHLPPKSLLGAKTRGESWNYCERLIMATLSDMKKGGPSR